MKFTRINKDEFAEFYRELQAIDEFEANFRSTTRSKKRKQELIAQLPVRLRNTER
tara:strand:+ start:5066 stop:5230 length:165 start_codon:yes stop_codon:yes gene_type:complete